VDFRRLAAPGTQHGSVVREGADIHRCGAGACPTKALHTTGNIGLEANAGLFTIIANIDPHFELLHDHSAHGRLYMPLELCPINALAALITDEQIAQRRGAWQAPHMCSKNAVSTSVHGTSSRQRLRTFFTDEA